MKNKLLFGNIRVHTVHVIKAAIMDLNLWKKALHLNEPVVPDTPVTHCPSIDDILPQEPCFYCVGDASWKSPYEIAGIGWS